MNDRKQKRNRTRDAKRTSRIAHSWKLGARSGFTLIEVLLYVAIVSIIFGSIMSLFDATFRSRIRNEIIAEVERGGNSVMNVIIQHIRNAQSVIAPAASSTASSLTLAMPDTNISPVVFQLSGGRIEMSERGFATTTLTSTRLVASGLSFTNLSRSTTPGAVRVIFTLDYANPDGAPTYHYRARFISGASLKNN